VIDQGRLLLDQPLERLRLDFLQRLSIVLVPARSGLALHSRATGQHRAAYRLALSVDKTTVAALEQVFATALQRPHRSLTS